jgi:hypothetical protein
MEEDSGVSESSAHARWLIFIQEEYPRVFSGRLLWYQLQLDTGWMLEIEDAFSALAVKPSKANLLEHSTVFANPSSRLSTLTLCRVWAQTPRTKSQDGQPRP